MKNDIFFRICAALLAACVVVTSATTVQVMKAYAAEEEIQLTEEEEEMLLQELIDEAVQEEQIQDSKLQSTLEDAMMQEEGSDPFDYNLVCYTPSINFGTIYSDEIVEARQFNIVNIGNTLFPITWEEIDQYTAFDMGSISYNEYMYPGDSMTFSISPREGLAPGSYSAKYTFFSANDIRRHHVAEVNVSVTVKKAEPYVLSVDIYPGEVTIPAGKTYSFSASVAGGNGYDQSVTWSLAGNENADTRIDANGNLTVASGESASSFVIFATSNQDHEVYDSAVVSVSKVDHIVSVNAEPMEGGVVAGSGAVRDGTGTTVSASPNNNYSFMGWFENGNLVSTDGQFRVENITSDRNFVAKFERKSCFVRTGVNDSNGGTITGSTSIECGGKITITAKANSGYRFDGFVEDNKTISTSSSIELSNVTSDRNITAIFNRETCNVNVSVSPQDTGKYEGAGTYNKGSRIELRASAYDGYEFCGWTINGQMVSRDSKYVIDNIQNDVSVIANFMKKSAPTFKLVSAITNEGGSITPSGDYTVAQGGSVTYNIVPQNEYNITAVMVDGKNIGAVSTYTFNNIQGGHTITATFEKKPVETPKKTDTKKVDQTKKTTDQTKKTTDQAKKTTASSGNDPNVQKKTEYNAETATQGAMPEQVIVDAEVPKNIEKLESTEYQEDVYTQAEALPAEEPKVIENKSVMAKHNLDEETLRRLINDDAVLPMLREAYEDGTLKITVNNSYAADRQETAVELYYENPTLINFEDVIAETLTADEKFQVLTGKELSFNIDITENTDTVDEGIKQVMHKMVGYKPFSYFDFVIMKTNGGSTDIINKTTAELEVRIPIPEKYIKEGRKYYVIRNHNGVIDLLQDIGNDPNSVTFRTDRFSEYAIAYEAININKLILRIVIVAIVALILAIICFVNLIKYKRKGRKQKS